MTTCTAAGKTRHFGRPDRTTTVATSIVSTVSKPVLYNLADVMRASLRGETVVWVEGEKDADNGKERLGLTTTTCPMGAKHFEAPLRWPLDGCSRGRRGGQ